MNITDRYILRAHIAPFIFGVSTVVFLFLMQFLMKYIDELLGKGLDEWIIIQLIGLNMSWMVVLAVPMGVLFSTLMAFGSMAASHEVTIIKASGGSLIRMMIPVVISGTLVTVGLFWFNDYVLPESNHRAKVLMSDIKRIKPTFTLESGRFSTDLTGYTILARKVDSISGILRGVTIYDRRSSHKVNVISADTGIVSFTPDYDKLAIDLNKGEIHQMDFVKLNNYRIVNFNDYRILIDAGGFNFERSSTGMMSRGDREMKISDMREIAVRARQNRDEARARLDTTLNKHLSYLLKGRADTTDKMASGPVKFDTDTLSTIEAADRAKKRISFLRTNIRSDIQREESYNNRSNQYEVEIQKKYAIPFACMVFLLIGCPLGIRTKGGNFGISAAISLGFYVFYWATLIGGEKLADRGILSPVLSMWLGNIIIGIAGIILVIRINNENFAVLEKIRNQARKLFFK
ncbi:MAG: LptF/LptG family permease [Candidatus Kapaibacterium sp.]